MKYWRVIYTPLFPVCLKIPGIAEVTGYNSRIHLWNPDQKRANPVIQEESQLGGAHAAGAEPPRA